MRYIITEKDKNILLQNTLDYKYKLYILDTENRIVGELNSIQSIGNYTIDSDSSVRRTTSIVFYLENAYRNIPVEQKLYEWIGYSFELQIGIYSIRDDDYVWYKCGYYLITEANTSYSAVDNSLSTSLSDWYAKLDGTRNGQIGGAPIIEIPVQTELEDGTIIKNTLKKIVEDTLKEHTSFKDYIVDDVGEFYGMEQNNPDYEKYREDRPNWNQLPYDLEYDIGSTIGDILDEIVNLYPNNQMYFDIYGNFCFNMTPSCENDMIVLDNEFLQKILLSDNSENVAYDISGIKNVTEVFGTTYTIDRTACIDNDVNKGVTTSGNVYILNIPKLDDDEDGYQYEYHTNDLLAFKVDSTNVAGMQLDISGLNEPIPILYEDTIHPIKAGEMLKEKMYVVKIENVVIEDEKQYVAYFLGQFQPHAICVLSNNKNDTTYTKEYFAEKYNCEVQNVVIRVEEDSPFAVQKIGEVLDCKVEEEFENIISDSKAMENAIYQNRRSSSMYDTVSITTKMIPFLDVQCKVRYKKQQDTEEKEYVVTSIDNDVESKTSSITLMRFYPLYYKD